MSQIKVISNLEESFFGRYDGEDYEFVPGEPTVLSLEAATHIFDLGKDDRSRAFNHLGWLIPGRSTYKDALEKLDKITFFEGKFVFDDEEGEEQPVEASGRSGKKTGGRRPHVDPSGNTGGSSQGEPSGDHAAA